MWSTTKKSSTVELTWNETVAEQKSTTHGTIIGIPPVLLVEGKCKRWFEVKIEKNRGGIYVGWVNEDVYNNFPTKNSLKKGIGCYEGTWAIDSYHSKVGTACQWSPPSPRSKKFKVGDVIGSTLDNKVGEIMFYLNGCCVGSFTGLPTNTKYYPACTLVYPKTKITANFEGPSPFPGFLPISSLTPQEIIQFETTAKLNFEYNHKNCLSPEGTDQHSSCCDASSSSSSSLTLLSLPPEILFECFKHLPAGTLVKLMRCCRYFRQLASDDVVWSLVLSNQNILQKDSLLTPKNTIPVTLIKPQFDLSHPTNNYLNKYKHYYNWQHGNYRPLCKWQCSGRVNCLARGTLNNKPILAAGSDSTVHFFSLSNMLPLLRPTKTNFIDVDSEILTMKIEDNLLITGGTSGLLNIYELDTAELLHEIVIPNRQDIESMEWNSTKLLMTAGWDMAIHFWDIQHGTLVQSLEGMHSEPITCLRYQDGLTFTTSYDKQIRAFCPSSNQRVLSLDFKEICNCIDFDTSSNSFAVGGEFGKINLYDRRFINPTSPNPFLYSYKKHTSVVKSLQFSSQTIVSAGYDHKAVAVDAREGRCLFEVFTGQAMCVSFDDEKLIVGDNTRRVHVFDLTQPPPSFHSPGRESIYLRWPYV